MSAIHVRDLDDRLIEALKSRARAHHRSLAGEVRAILTEAVMGEQTIPAETAQRRRPLRLHTVSIGSRATFSRDELYGDDGNR